VVLVCSLGPVKQKKHRQEKPKWKLAHLASAGNKKRQAEICAQKNGAGLAEGGEMRISPGPLLNHIVETAREVSTKKI
jgi:hypothetical protein